ncbi:hypothetical protein Tco_0027214 [Tanacetum coccineum]
MQCHARSDIGNKGEGRKLVEYATRVLKNCVTFIIYGQPTPPLSNNNNEFAFAAEAAQDNMKGLGGRGRHSDEEEGGRSGRKIRN